MEDVFSYYDVLKSAYEKNKLLFRKNSDCAHNAMIMRLMLEKSRHISMYCGEMSVFRSAFYNKIKESDSAAGERIETEVRKALVGFLAKEDSSIDIILENEPACLFNDFIVPYADLKDKVHLAYLPGYIDNKSSIGHFSFTEDEKIVRLELDKKEHVALCKIGDIEGADKEVPSPKSNFMELKKAAISYNYNIV